MSRRHTAVALAGLAIAALALPAAAAPPKPITESYSLELAPVPLPLVGGAPTATSCMLHELEGIHQDTRVIKPKGKGTLEVKVTNFSMDWDITLLDADGAVLGSGTGSVTGETTPLEKPTETLKMKFKKNPKELQLAICNFAGSPTADVTYTFKHE